MADNPALDFAMTFSFICIHYDIAPHHLREIIEKGEAIIKSRSDKKRQEAKDDLNNVLLTYHATLELDGDDTVVVFNNYRVSLKQLFGEQ